MTRDWVFKYIMQDWKAKRSADAEAGLLDLRNTSKEDSYLSVHYDYHYYLGKLLSECSRKDESQTWFRLFLELCDLKNEFSADYRKNRKRIIKEASRDLGYTKSAFGQFISIFKKT